MGRTTIDIDDHKLQAAASELGTTTKAETVNAALAYELDRLGRLGLLATCPTVDLEVLYSARSPDEYAAIARRRASAFADLPFRSEIGDRAKAVQAAMARTSQHRAAGVVDLLTAAVAEHYKATVLHHDADFDYIARITRQPTQWVVPQAPTTPPELR